MPWQYWVVVAGSAICSSAAPYFAHHAGTGVHVVEVALNWLPWLLIAAFELGSYYAS